MNPGNDRWADKTGSDGKRRLLDVLSNDHFGGTDKEAGTTTSSINTKGRSNTNS